MDYYGKILNKISKKSIDKIRTSKILILKDLNEILKV